MALNTFSTRIYALGNSQDPAMPSELATSIVVSVVRPNACDDGIGPQPSVQSLEAGIAALLTGDVATLYISDVDGYASLGIDVEDGRLALSFVATERLPFDEDGRHEASSAGSVPTALDDSFVADASPLWASRGQPWTFDLREPTQQ